MKAAFCLIFAVLLAVPGLAASNLNNATVTLTTVATSTTSALGLAANSKRKTLFIQNVDATDTVYVKFGSAHSGTEGIKLIAGASYQSDVPPIGAIYLKSSANTPSVTIYSGE